MSDAKKTVKELADEVKIFVEQREWHQFHSPKNLSMNIAIEAAELMEKFLWLSTDESRDEIAKNRDAIEDELADIFMTILCFAGATDIDLSDALRKKMVKTAQKYPVEKSRGKHTKYDKL